MDHKECVGAPNHALIKVHHLMFIRMGRKAGHIIDFGSDDDFFAHNLDFLGTIHELPSQTAFCLIAGKYDGTILTPQVVFQMMEHAARVSHAAGRNDDHWAWHVIDGPRFFRCFRIMDVGHVDEASPCFDRWTVPLHHTHPD